MQKEARSQITRTNQAGFNASEAAPEPESDTLRKSSEPACYVSELARFVRLHYDAGSISGDAFCAEVANVTSGQARMTLPHHLEDRLRLSEYSALVLPVRFGSLRYGDLFIAEDPEHPGYPLLPLTVCTELAQSCGWLVHVMYEGILIRRQFAHLSDGQQVDELSERQRQVLTLMARGLSREAIADHLAISATTVDSHRQSIYRRLGVHSALEAVFLAHKVGMLLMDGFQHSSLAT